MRNTRNAVKLSDNRSYRKAIDISIDSIPKDIEIFNLSPFDSNGMNKRFILSCFNLHPVFNVIGIRANGSFIPVTDKIQLMTYFGGVSTNTIDHFIRAMLEKGILIVFNISNFACMYMINPDYAINKSNNSSLTRRLFEFTLNNRELYEINDRYLEFDKSKNVVHIKDNVKLGDIV